jgi:PPP family 3-phenylpropionic acid transporter
MPGYHPQVNAIRALFLLAGAILGVFYPFLSAILAERGFTPAEIGLTAALASLAFMLAVPVWGHVADVVIGRVSALRVGVVGSTIAVLGLLLNVPPVIVVVLVVIYAAFESSLSPLADALAVNALGRSPRSYARVRLLSSVGFAATSILAGRLYDDTGFWPAPILWATAAVGILIVSRWVPDVARFRTKEFHAEAVVERAARRGGSFALVVRTQPRLRGLLLGLGLVHVGMLAGFTFLALRLLELGGQPSDVALSAGVSALAEIPAMALIPRIVNRTGVRALLVAGILLYAASFVAWAFVDAPTLIVATRVVSGVGFAAITIAAVMIIATLLPPELQATGQGLYQTVAFGGAAVVANLVGGVVFGSGGAMPLFLGCAVLAALGAVVIWRTIPVQGQAARVRSRP